MSSFMHSVCGGCAGSGLKLVSVFSSVLCAYVVAWRLSCLRVMSRSRVWIVVCILSFVGDVSPSMFSSYRNVCVGGWVIPFFIMLVVSYMCDYWFFLGALCSIIPCKACHVGCGCVCRCVMYV